MHILNITLTCISFTPYVSIIHTYITMYICTYVSLHIRRYACVCIIYIFMNIFIQNAKPGEDQFLGIVGTYVHVNICIKYILFCMYVHIIMYVCVYI